MIMTMMLMTMAMTMMKPKGKPKGMIEVVDFLHDDDDDCDEHDGDEDERRMCHMSASVRWRNKASLQQSSGCVTCLFR